MENFKREEKESRKDKFKWLKVAAIAVLFVGTGIGMFYGGNIAATKGFILTGVPEKAAGDLGKISDANKYSDLFELRSLLMAKYDGDIDDTVLLEGAMKGMASALGDPYTVYMNSDEYKNFIESNNNFYEHDKEKQIFLIKWINENIFENNDFLDQIGQIFIEEHIMQVSCIRHDYSNQKSWMQEICNYYINAYERLLKIDECGINDEILSYVQYSILYCKEKINKLFEIVFGGMGLKYNTKDLVYEMEEILEKNKNFYNIHVLQGLATNLDLRYYRDTPGHLLECVDKLKDRNK